MQLAMDEYCTKIHTNIKLALKPNFKSSFLKSLLKFKKILIIKVCFDIFGLKCFIPICYVNAVHTTSSQNLFDYYCMTLYLILKVRGETGDRTAAVPCHGTSRHIFQYNLG